MNAGAKILTASCVVALLGFGVCSGIPRDMDNISRAVLGSGMLVLGAIGAAVGAVVMVIQMIRHRAAENGGEE